MPHEDKIILDLHAKGHSWAEMAAYLPGRLSKKIRERYVDMLDPTLKKSPWSREEDAILDQLQGQLGNKWAFIGQFLPGRSQNAIKNRYHSRRRASERRLREMEDTVVAAQPASEDDAEVEEREIGSTQKPDGAAGRDQSQESSETPPTT